MNIIVFLLLFLLCRKDKDIILFIYINVYIVFCFIDKLIKLAPIFTACSLKDIIWSIFSLYAFYNSLRAVCFSIRFVLLWTLNCIRKHMNHGERSSISSIDDCKILIICSPELPELTNDFWMFKYEWNWN